MKSFHPALQLCWLAAVLLAGAGHCAAQSSSLGLSKGGGFSHDPATEGQIRLQQVYKAEEKKMVQDSQKLVELANKLNAEVAAQHGGALTPAERKEVEQIEKLAHSVRTKMQQPVPTSPAIQPDTQAYAIR